MHMHAFITFIINTYDVFYKACTLIRIVYRHNLCRVIAHVYKNTLMIHISVINKFVPIKFPQRDNYNSNIRSELYIYVCGGSRNIQTGWDQFADIPDGFYKFLAYFSGKREQPWDRPTERPI